VLHLPNCLAVQKPISSFRITSFGHRSDIVDLVSEALICTCLAISSSEQSQRVCLPVLGPCFGLVVSGNTQSQRVLPPTTSLQTLNLEL
jgi:hypothetical protein